MADNSDIPAARFTLPGYQISQAPFLQSWNGQAPPFANTQDQIQQSLAISGVYPGQMPDNTFLDNTAARYAFGRTLPGSSPYQGALTSYMQGRGMPTGIPLGILGLQGGIGQPPPPNSSGPPYPGGGSPGTYAPPGGYGPPNLPGAGNPAPPPFPGGAGGPGAGGPLPPTPPGAGQSNRGAFNTGMWNGTGGLGGGGGHRGGGLLSGGQQQLTQSGMQALQGVTDPAMRYMISQAYHIPGVTAGLTNDQINSLAQSTMGSVYNRKTGQVQNGVY